MSKIFNLKTNGNGWGMVESENAIGNMGLIGDIFRLSISRDDMIWWQDKCQLCPPKALASLLPHCPTLWSNIPIQSMIEYVRYSALKRRVLSDTLKWEPILQVNEEKCLTLSRSIKISECDLEGMHLALCNHRTCLYNEGLDRVILFSREIAPKLRKAYAHEIGVDLEPTHTPCLVIHCSSFEWAFKEDASGMSQIWNWKTTGDVKEYEVTFLQFVFQFVCLFCRRKH